MRIGVGQLDLKCCDVEYNINQTAMILEDATANLIDVLVLPEMTNSGYYFDSQDEAWMSSETIPEGPFSKILLEWSKNRGLVLAGINEQASDILFNSAVVFASGKHLGTYRKINLFGSEKEWFKTGPQEPFVVEHEGYSYGSIICFEWNFPELIASSAREGAQIILHPLNSGIERWRDAMRKSAIENRVITASANRVGVERGRQFSGGSTIIGSNGKILLKMDSKSTKLGWVDI
ncbi:MAG: nitrilase-related carbon-nitrogen hydrolase [Candidatus Thorarchaeota archaeon]